MKNAIECLKCLKEFEPKQRFCCDNCRKRYAENKGNRTESSDKKDGIVLNPVIPIKTELEKFYELLEQKIEEKEVDDSYKIIDDPQ